MHVKVASAAIVISREGNPADRPTTLVTTGNSKDVARVALVEYDDGSKQTG